MTHAHSHRIPANRFPGPLMPKPFRLRALGGSRFAPEPPSLTLFFRGRGFRGGRNGRRASASHPERTRRAGPWFDPAQPHSYKKNSGAVVQTLLAYSSGKIISRERKDNLQSHSVFDDSSQFSTATRKLKPTRIPVGFPRRVFFGWPLQKPTLERIIETPWGDPAN